MLITIAIDTFSQLATGDSASPRSSTRCKLVAIIADALQEEWRRIPHEKKGSGALRVGISEALKRCLEAQFVEVIQMARGKLQSHHHTLQILAKAVLARWRQSADKFRNMASAASDGLYDNKFFSVAGDVGNNRKLRAALLQAGV